MKNLLLVLVLASVASICHGQFRNTTWGMSLDEVVAAEGAGEISHGRENGRERTIMSFTRRLLGYQTAVSFHFYDGDSFFFHYGELRTARYQIYSSREDDAYAEVYSALLERFGSPDHTQDSRTIWVEGRTEISLSEWPDLGWFMAPPILVTYTDTVWRAQRLEAQRKEDASAF